MWKTAMVALALCGCSNARASGTAVSEPGERVAFAEKVRAVIERGDVGGFIALLAPDVLMCGDEPIRTSEVVGDLKHGGAFHALVFDTAALKKGPRRTIRRQLSYMDFFRLAKDTRLTVDEGFNWLRWRSESLGDIDEPPSFGVVAVQGALRIGVISEACVP